MKELRVDYVSDLHLNFYTYYNKELELHYPTEDLDILAEKILSKKDGDVLVIAGDINEYVETIVYFLKQVAKGYDKVFYVVGNHEYYTWFGKERKKYEYSSLKKIATMASLLSETDNIVLLDRCLNKGIYNYNGFTIAGDTFWYCPSTVFGWCDYLATTTDFTMVKERGHSAVSRIKKYHTESMEWYNSLPDDVDLIVTHISPVPNIKAEHGKSQCYSNPVENLKSKVWVYGHDHKEADFMRGDTRLVSNPWGYDTKEFPVKTLTLRK